MIEGFENPEEAAAKIAEQVDGPGTVAVVPDFMALYGIERVVKAFARIGFTVIERHVDALSMFTLCWAGGRVAQVDWALSVHHDRPTPAPVLP